MTTVAVIQGPTWVVIAADSQSSDEDGSSIMIPDGKVFKNGGVVFAAAGAVRGINILQHDFTVPDPSKIRDTDKYVTRQLIPAIRRTFIEAGYEFPKPEASVMNDNVWIIVVHAKAYLMAEDYSWERSVDGLYAAGSGANFALGAMEALGGSNCDDLVKAKKIATKAIQIAIRRDAFTGGKITVNVVSSG